MAATTRDAAPPAVTASPTLSGGIVPYARDARSAFLALAVGAAIWEVAGQVWHFSFLPPLSNVVLAAAQLIASGQIVGNLAASLSALGIGYALAVVGGVALGLAMGRYRAVEYFFDPYINALLATPKIALVPILFAFFGINRNVQIAVVFLSSFFIIVTTTMSAIRTVDVSYVEMAQSFGAKERQIFWRVLLPGALPLTFAGLRLGMGRAVRGMINGEMYIALFGLGALLRTYGSRFDAEKVFAILLVVIIIALIFSAIVQTLERRLTRWVDAT